MSADYDKDEVLERLANLQPFHGKNGRDGRDGRDGSPGQRGMDGAPGMRGERGLTGPAGPQGPQGIEGKSIIGPMGPRGERGLPGDTGPEGVQGPPGPMGPEGPRGPQGVRGPKGDIPRHEWRDVDERREIRFELPGGEWGPWMDVRGPAGRDGHVNLPTTAAFGGSVAGGLGAPVGGVSGTTGSANSYFPGGWG